MSDAILNADYTKLEARIAAWYADLYDGLLPIPVHDYGLEHPHTGRWGFQQIPRGLLSGQLAGLFFFSTRGRPRWMETDCGEVRFVLEYTDAQLRQKFEKLFVVDSLAQAIEERQFPYIDCHAAILDRKPKVAPWGKKSRFSPGNPWKGKKK